MKPTFISSTDIVFSDDEEDGASSSAGAVDPSTSGGVGAAPASLKGRNSAATISRPSMSARASKTAALNALSARVADKGAKRIDREASSSGESPGPSFSSSTPFPGQPAPHRNPARKAHNVPRAPALNFDTLRTFVPRYPNPPPRPEGQSRIFGLDHAPVYHPTVDEFARPMEYIEKVAREAKHFGICKIVPPEGWRPPFALNTETFRFKTRLQVLNSMEASARASLNFLEQLYIFHRQQGSSGIAVPTVAGRPLDLWKLKREVGILGGYYKVTSGRKWTTIGKTMGYSLQVSSAVCSQIKNAYLRIVVPFEDYVKRVKLAGGTPPPDPTILKDDVPIADAISQHLGPATPKVPTGAESLATPCSQGDVPVARKTRAGEVLASEKVRTASDKLNEALNAGRAMNEPSTKLAGLLPSRDLRATRNDSPGEVCEICTMDHDPDKIVLCDGCDRGYHLSCLSPPLSDVPTSQFFCDTCLLMEGAEYGFEEGHDHSLHSFRRRADAFKRNWLLDHPMPPTKGKGRQMSPSDMALEQDVMKEQLAIEDHFEREFWRLVESPTECVEIEYGADVNHTKDGGGLPNLEVHPNDPYSRDGWNLNNLPILAGSLLRYIKSDISGMTIPWMYVGMVFSTFAWHKEDHYTYSINYHHWGDTKTWYGISGADDEKLEAAMKLAAPELFEQQPDLMFQLVTLMSPGRLQKHGVRVVACDQRPNEFVITFPRAYHSGFNHGFNFNEAVNFALPDWLPTGLKCVNRYQDIRKNPVFSHDELLVTISQHEKSPRSSRWLYPNWKEMVDREIASRERFRRLVPGTPEVVLLSDINEEDYQCDECRTLGYLSQALSSDGSAVFCIDHFRKVPGGAKLLRLRYSDDDLRTMLAKVKARSDKAGRVSEFLIGNDSHDRARTTGRKRKPSALALEAAGEDIYPVAQKVKVEPSAASGDDYEDDEGDCEDGGDNDEMEQPPQRVRSLHVPPDVSSPPPSAVSRAPAPSSATAADQPRTEMASWPRRSGEDPSPPHPRTVIQSHPNYYPSEASAHPALAGPQPYSSDLQSIQQPSGPASFPSSHAYYAGPSAHGVPYWPSRSY